jgi:hypothetical protein
MIGLYAGAAAKGCARPHNPKVKDQDRRRMLISIAIVPIGTSDQEIILLPLMGSPSARRR